MIIIKLFLLFTVLSTLNCKDVCPVEIPLGFTYSGQKRDDEYDYIVVGAGSSGSVVASRLSENPKVTVLLLEAGGPPPGIGQIPLCKDILKEFKDTEWGYYTEPQKNAFLENSKRQGAYSQYKALGGCSSHNGMAYVRGNQKDYDGWVKMGADGWSWKDVLPIFKFSENNTDPELVKDGFHGTNGYQTVSSPMYENQLRQAYCEAGKTSGYKEVDYNDGSQFGYSAMQLTQRDGERCSTEKAFLRPAASRPNLDILTYATVTGIQFDKDGDGSITAKRVKYDHKNQTELVVSARREIILSAGAIRTPQILLLSGIGPKDDLEKLKIPVIANLPVGKNFQDHVFSSAQAWTLNDTVGIVRTRDRTQEALSDFKDGKGGIFSSPETMENMFFINTEMNKGNEDWPDIQIITRSSLMSFRLSKIPELKDRDITQMLTFLMRPKSRGFVKLRSTDPYENPIIDPKFFADEEDLLRLAQGMKLAGELLATPSLQRFEPVPIRDLAPNCTASLSEWNSVENMACVAKYTTAAGLHGCCTAKMGNPDDETTVVDPNLKVKGIKGLRVADASVMPTVVSANTNGPCIMIGEKAARMIAEENQD